MKLFIIILSNSSFRMKNDGLTLSNKIHETHEVQETKNTFNT